MSPQRQQLLAERGLDVEEQDQKLKGIQISSKSHQLQMSENPAMSMRIPGVLPKASQSLNNTLRIGHSPLFTDVSFSAHSSDFGKVAALRTSLETPTPKTYHNYWQLSLFTKRLQSSACLSSCCLSKFRCLQPTSRLAVFPLVWGNLDLHRPAAATECLMLLTSFAGMVHQATRLDPKSILRWVPLRCLQ